MVGILLMTHAPLGQAFVAAVAHVFRGPTDHFEAIDVMPDQDLNEVHQLALEAIKRVDDGNGVLVITDIKGGTPSNTKRCAPYSRRLHPSRPSMTSAVMTGQSLRGPASSRAAAISITASA